MGYLFREFKRILHRAWNSYEGIRVAWIEEPSFSQWSLVNIISIIASFFVEMARSEQIMIIAFGLMILVVELLNTGVEAAIDRISNDIHELSKKAKDVACAAVAMTSFMLLVAWGFVLFG